MSPRNTVANLNIFWQYLNHLKSDFDGYWFTQYNNLTSSIQQISKEVKQSSSSSSSLSWTWPSSASASHICLLVWCMFVYLFIYMNFSDFYLLIGCSLGVYLFIKSCCDIHMLTCLALCIWLSSINEMFSCSSNVCLLLIWSFVWCLFAHIDLMC